jgi:hypothetical protein
VQAGARVAVHQVEFSTLGFVIQVLAERLQEHRVEPPLFPDFEPQPSDVVVGVNDAPDELFSLL